MTNHPAQGITDAGSSENSPSKSQSWWRYFTFNTDHKVIGIQYLGTSFFFFLFAGLLAMLIRAELITPPRIWWIALFTMACSPCTGRS